MDATEADAPCWSALIERLPQRAMRHHRFAVGTAAATGRSVPPAAVTIHGDRPLAVHGDCPHFSRRKPVCSRQRAISLRKWLRKWECPRAPRVARTAYRPRQCTTATKPHVSTMARMLRNDLADAQNVDLPGLTPIPCRRVFSEMNNRVAKRQASSSLDHRSTEHA